MRRKKELAGGLLNSGRIFRETRTTICRYQDHPWPRELSAALARLRDRGFYGAPAVVQQIDDLTVVLTYIPGFTLPTPVPNWARSSATLDAVTGLVGRFSIAGRGIVRPNDRFFTNSLGGRDFVHGDPHPSNIVFGFNRKPRALIDFELATSGTELSNLCSLLFTWAPLEPLRYTCWRDLAETAPEERVRRIITKWPSEIRPSEIIKHLSEFLDWRSAWLESLARIGNPAAVSILQSAAIDLRYVHARKVLESALDHPIA